MVRPQQRATRQSAGETGLQECLQLGVSAGCAGRCGCSLSCSFGSAHLLSAGGVQQGDPLGPLLFAGALHSLALELRQGPLDMAFFYLDDGVVAGDAAAVGAALAHIQAQSANLGLHLNLDKSEVISLGATSHPALVGLTFRRLCSQIARARAGSRPTSNFSGLQWVRMLLSLRTQQSGKAASQLLDAISGLDDPQLGLRLLRSSGGHCRLVHSMRCTPPAAQLDSFKAFDQGVRACFSSLTGLHPTDAQWQQAARGFDQAGLGLRSTHLDGPAAYLASLGKSRTLCGQLAPSFSNAETLASSHAAAALHLYNGHLPSCSASHFAHKLGPTTEALTKVLDAVGWEAQLSASSLTGRALLLSEAAPGARAFPGCLACMASSAWSQLFLSRRHRLGIPDAGDDAWCPQCNGILDCFSLHAGTCSAGGERTLRHHALRDTIYKWG